MATTTPDYSLTTYTYTVNPDGSVTYAANADGQTQTLAAANCPTSGTQADLEAYLDAYTQAYLAGKRQEQPAVSSSLTTGKAVTADAGTAGA